MDAEMQELGDLEADANQGQVFIVIPFIMFIAGVNKAQDNIVAVCNLSILDLAQW